jgi:prepilin signal peptidase PulO-like enzyme (type II secretory pathway)
MRAAPASSGLGALPTRFAVSIMVGFALLGVIGTVVTGREPGFLLGLCVTVGSVIAALTIRRRKMHVLIPLPALLLFLGAVLTGAYHDRAVDTSTTTLGVNFLQWLAQVFFAMGAATILVLVIAGARWLLSRQLVSGQFPMSGNTRAAPGTRPGGGAGPGRGPRDPRGGAPWASGDGRGGTPDNRDPWGNRGAPPDRDRWGMGGWRNNSDREGDRDRRDNRDSRGNRDPWASADRPGSDDPRDDHRRTF